jgi:hypothetical protein
VRRPLSRQACATGFHVGIARCRRSPATAGFQCPSSRRRSRRKANTSARCSWIWAGGASGFGARPDNIIGTGCRLRARIEPCTGNGETVAAPGPASAGRWRASAGRWRDQGRGGELVSRDPLDHVAQALTGSAHGLSSLRPHNDGEDSPQKGNQTNGNSPIPGRAYAGDVTRDEVVA